MIDRAEDPEKLIKQVILDMENQYLQVKTQVAVSIADQHMLEKKWHENDDSGKDWMHKAEVAVDKGQDDLARAALDRARQLAPDDPRVKANLEELDALEKGVDQPQRSP
jgi:phage shock protein A